MHAQPGPQAAGGGGIARSLTVDRPPANSDSVRTESRCPLGQWIDASASAIVRRDSNVAPHDRHRYS